MRCELVNVQCFDLAFLCTCEKVALSSFSNVRPTHMPSNEDAPSFLMLWGHDDYTSLSFFFSTVLVSMVVPSLCWAPPPLSLSVPTHTLCRAKWDRNSRRRSVFFLFVWCVLVDTCWKHSSTHTHTHTRVSDPSFFWLARWARQCLEIDDRASRSLFVFPRALVKESLSPQLGRGRGVGFVGQVDFTHLLSLSFSLSLSLSLSDV